MDIFEELVKTYPALSGCLGEIQAAGKALVDAYRAGGKLLVCGNGGSGADAEHIVGELMKQFILPRPLSREEQERLRAVDPLGAHLAEHLQGALPAIPLTGNIALSTAYANDAEPELVFAQQVWGYGRPGDVLLAISTSGSSRNVCAAIVAARAKDMTVIGLTGSRKGSMNGLCHICIQAPSAVTYQVQEYHLPIYHALCRYVEAEIFGK